MVATFAPHLSSLDPQLTKEGKPYGPHRFKEIVRERYTITKHTNTSYQDTESMTPVERSYMLEFIVEDLQRQKDLYDKAKQEHESKRPHSRRR